MNEDARQSAGAESAWVRFVADDQGSGVIGYGYAGHHIGMSPGRFQVSVVVAPEARGRGTGSALLASVEDWIGGQAVRDRDGLAAPAARCELVAFAPGDDGDSLAWAQNRGYRLDLERSEAVLDLKSWDDEAFLGHLDQVQGAGAEDGVKLTVLLTEEPLPLGLLRGVYAVEADASQDEPGFDGGIPSWEEWLDEFRRSGSTKVLALAMGGEDGKRVVGVSQVSMPAVPGAGAHTNFTGVRRDYRGRGIALALKVLTIEAVRARGIETMTANNDSANLPMLAVNRRLGYRILPGPRRLKKDLQHPSPL